MNRSNIRVTVWNEYRHEIHNEGVKEIYPEGIHQCIADFIGTDKDIEVVTATLDQEEHGLTNEVLNNTDVLIWWGHLAHEEVADEVVQRIYDRVLDGMGLIALHSAHYSKIFRKLMGTNCILKWREADDNERLWVVNPGHPIVDGVEERIDLENEEMYGEFFDIPEPDELIFVSWFKGGEVFRSGCTFHRGKGKIFYFRPGHETYPTYQNKQIQKVIMNAVRWAVSKNSPKLIQGNVEPIEK
ncbi:ThuA domain-containing protein [Lederbergia ruris]|uniref:ThuA domain-containing protein n=1 Tax=Lederbergia ruris TaxID=217495 RepID=UPI00399F9F24